ncbi:MAG: hypothetical protein ABMA64_22295 [Myxococcota bacterium]
MFPLPLTWFSFEVLLTPEEVADRLAEAVEPLRIEVPILNALLGEREHRPLAGSVSDPAFEVRRVTPGWHNSFRPVLYGRISDLGPGRSRVKVVATLHPVVAVFAALCCAADVALAPHPGFGVGIMVVMTVAGFWAEVRPSRELLQDVLSETEP